MRYIEITGSTLLIALICLVSCSSGTTRIFTPAPEKLVGKWEGTDHTGKQGAFQFFDDGNIILIIDGRPLGGPDSNGLGRLTYTADFAKDPIELDIIGIDSTGDEHGKILMIVKFLTRDKIKIRTYFSETRPLDFDTESTDDTIILDRQPR
jgi:hypothetical protein